MHAFPHDIIIVRGAPGSGKTQAAKCLSQFFPKGVKLEVDTVRQMVISVDWKNQQEHINMLQASAGLACDFLKLGFRPVIVVDTFSGDKIVRFIELIRQFDGGLSIGIFGLFATEDELEARLELRKNGEFKDVAISKKLNGDVLKFRHDTEIQIDTTRLSPIQTAHKILEHLSLCRELNAQKRVSVQAKMAQEPREVGLGSGLSAVFEKQETASVGSGARIFRA